METTITTNSYFRGADLRITETPPYTTRHDGRGWRVLQHGVVMADECHGTFEAAQAVADYLNAEDDEYTGADRTATVNLKEGSPAVEVKDRTMYHADRAFSEAYNGIGERRAEVLYEQAQHDFWQVTAPSIAAEHEFDAGAIGQAGRSGGWLTLDDLSFWDYIVEDGTIPEGVPPADEDPEPDEADPGWDLWRDRQDAREEYAEMRAERERFFRFALDITAAVGAASEDYAESVKQAARVGALVDAVWRD